MEDIEPPRTAMLADRTRTAGAPKLTEPATAAALWPTFMRRTLEDRQVRPGMRDGRPDPEPRRAA